MIKTSALIKMGIYLIIVVGILVYLYGLYQAGTNLKIEDVKIRTVEIIPPTSLRFKVNVDFNNPANQEIDVSSLMYKVYLEDKYIGEGYKFQLSIPHNFSTSILEFEFDVKDTVVGAVKAGDNANITVKGQVNVPIKVFGLFTYKTVTVPYTYTKQVSISGTVNKTGKALIDKAAQAIDKVVQTLSESTPTATSIRTLPVPTLPSRPTLPKSKL